MRQDHQVSRAVCRQGVGDGLPGNDGGMLDRRNRGGCIAHQKAATGIQGRGGVVLSRNVIRQATRAAPQVMGVVIEGQVQVTLGGLSGKYGRDITRGAAHDPELVN